MGIVAVALVLWRLDRDDSNGIDADSVVMLGDSITAEGTRILHELKETWTSLHFTITKLTKAYEKNH